MSTDVPGALGGLVPEIRRVVRRIARQDADVDDIVQECCLRILRKERLWNPDRGSLKSWIGTLARNLTINYLFARSRATPALPAQDDSAQADLQHLEWLRREFSRLPAAQKEALLMVYYHDLNTTETAKALGITRPAVADRLARALKTLRGRARGRELLAAAIPWPELPNTGLEAAFMSVKQKVMMTAVASLFVGAAAMRIAVDAVRPESPVGAAEAVRLTAENRALKRQLAAAIEERRALAESGAALPATASPQAPSEPASPASPVPAQTAGSEAALRAGLKDAGDVADLLGLEPARKKYFEDLHERVWKQVQDAEKKHAQVTRRENNLEIRIPAFPEEGRTISEAWEMELNAALTPSERERYRRFQLDLLLFPRGIGRWDRVTEFDAADPLYGATFHEKWAGPGEEPRTQSVWSGPAADRCYAHLVELPKR